MKNKIAILLALAGMMGAGLPAHAAFTFEGLKPLVLKDCVKPGEEPYADEDRYRQDSDTRPECPQPKPRQEDAKRPAPAEEKVPQK